MRHESRDTRRTTADNLAESDQVQGERHRPALPRDDRRSGDDQLSSPWALRKDATPAIFDGASQLQSVGSAAFLRAYLSHGTVIEPNYKSILALRRVSAPVVSVRQPC